MKERKRPRTKQPHRRSAQAERAAPQVAELKLVEIEKPIYGGSFLARLEGKAVFVPLTLPGEQVRIRVTSSKRGYDSADPEEIVTPAAVRVAPACPHFGACGGCDYQHTDYETQLEFKKAILRETLQRGGVEAPAEIDVVAAEPWRYRNRIRVAFDAAGRLGYRGRRSHAVIAINECPIAAPLLVSAAKGIAEVARRSPDSLRLTEIALFCNADESALLASAFASAASKAPFNDFLAALGEQIPALRGAEVVAEGNAGEPARTLAQWGASSLTYPAAGFAYRVGHGAFFQVNRFLVDALVERVTKGHRGRLAWDLFAGVGLFARRLTAAFDKVVAVESAPCAIEALEENLKGTTGDTVRATTLDFLRRNRKAAKFNEGSPDLIVVDPPRAGLGQEITMLLAEVGAPALVYVSCDPATLARDLRALLATGYAIDSITLVDLFPQTFHLETVVQLRRS
jgi:23S rRNA (uracil1939-C5)-methyltransferase